VRWVPLPPAVPEPMAADSLRCVGSFKGLNFLKDSNAPRSARLALDDAGSRPPPRRHFFATLCLECPTSESYSTTVGENRHITLMTARHYPRWRNAKLRWPYRNTRARSSSLRAKRCSGCGERSGHALHRFGWRATVIAIGTAFDVLRDSDRAIVSVTEGRVLSRAGGGFHPVSLML